MDKAIGGYLEFEFRKGHHYHAKALKLNSGRNCLKYILLSRKYKKLYIPYYTCEVILQPIIDLKIDYEFYSIDSELNPVFNKNIAIDEAFLYTNYYGIKQKTVIELSKRIKNLIIDNAQAFFSPPIKGVDTFYSARKFFGVPDGGYLYTNAKTDLNITEYEESLSRIRHLIIRHEKGAQEGYMEYISSEEMHNNSPIRYMSKISDGILQSLDYPKIKLCRYDNYIFLQNKLSLSNNLHIKISKSASPLAYPYLTNKKGLRDYLIRNKIFVPKYWENVYKWTQNQGLEAQLTSFLIPLPIDQRYSEKDMNRIVKTIKNYHGE